MTSGKSVVSSTNKTDRHDITKIMSKVALNTIALTLAMHYNIINVFLSSDK
jgi:hypothetical protein